MQAPLSELLTVFLAQINQAVATTIRAGVEFTYLLKVDRPPSERMGANTSCMKRTPTLYMSNLSGAFNRQSTGESSAATGFGGALQTCKFGLEV